MLRIFSRPVPLLLILALGTFIPVMMALVRVVQIPVGSYPDDSTRLAVAPVAWFFHALAGASFGILGPLQFARALQQRYGRLHRISGRLFVLAGMFLGLSGLRLLFQVPSISTELLDVYRGLAALGLLTSLGLALAAIHAKDFPRHRAWMIRAYAIGMGSGTVALVFFPIYLITGQPPTGVVLDLIFVTWWSANIAFAEWIIRRFLPQPQKSRGFA